MNKWFETWFNTEDYLNVYRSRNNSEARKHVDFILKNVKLEKRDKVLDLACGPGRHSIIFAGKGFEVTAVDLSEKLLCVAKKTAEDAELKIDFRRSDLREIKLGKKFDLVVNLFTSFGYFEEDEENYKIFDVVKEHLSEKGTFVIDYFNTGYLQKNLEEYSENIILDNRIVQRRAIAGDRVVKNIEIDSQEGKKIYYESVRMFSPGEIINAMTCRGFKLNRIYGDFNGNNFDPDKSERLIIFAMK
jgi:cyclopropane fatty-acyl-phospholipid synthase-like methyltransferase